MAEGAKWELKQLLTSDAASRLETVLRRGIMLDRAALVSATT